MITIWVPKRLVEVDLYNVAARSPQALAQLSENSYARRVQYAAQKVRGSGAKIVMLTGPSASGKTTSAHCLAKALVQQGTPAQVVSLDNFFKGAAYYPKMPDGTLDYVVGTNLTYRLPELLTRWICPSSSSVCTNSARPARPSCPSMILPPSSALPRWSPSICRAVCASLRASMPSTRS